jgi:hypothetical protein
VVVATALLLEQMVLLALQLAITADIVRYLVVLGVLFHSQALLWQTSVHKVAVLAVLVEITVLLVEQVHLQHTLLGVTVAVVLALRNQVLVVAVVELLMVLVV